MDNVASTFLDDDCLGMDIYWHGKGLEKAPGYADANMQSAQAYRQRAWEEGNLELYRKALPYMDTYIGAFPEDDYGYLIRASIKKGLNMTDAGLEDARMAVKLESDSPYNWNMLGKLLFYKKEYEEAQECFLKAIQQLTNPSEQGRAIYENIAQNYEVMENVEETAKWYLDGMQIFEGDNLKHFMIEASEFYLRKKMFNDAKKVYRALYEKGFVSYDWYRTHILMARVGKCKSRTALVAILITAKWVVWRKPECSQVKAYYATILAYYAESRKGYKLKKRYADSLQTPKEYWDNLDCLHEMASLAALRNKKELSREYATHFIEGVLAHYHSLVPDITDEEAIEMYCVDPHDNFANMCFLGICYLYLDEIDKAKVLMERLERTRWCRECVRGSCESHMRFWGQYYEMTGELKKAYLVFRRGFKRYKLAGFCRWRMVVLSRKLKEKIEEDWLRNIYYQEPAPDIILSDD